jgi:transglutaminase-like putative cysteine protease
MRLRIEHRTTYAYEAPVAFGLQQLRLTPKSRIGQSVLTWRTQIEGGTRQLEFDDQHMNRVMTISFSGAGHRIVVTSSGEVETADMSGVVGKHAGFAPLWYFQRPTRATRAGAGVRSLVKGLAAEFPDPIARCHALMARVAEAVVWEPGTTTPETTAEEALAQGRGVCQDHAHLFIAGVRLLGLPARYVSGYLMMEDRPEQDASHAWAEAHVDGLGWVGFDPSNLISPDARYVRVATGLDHAEAAPVTGLRDAGAAGESLSVELRVQQSVDIQVQQ